MSKGVEVLPHCTGLVYFAKISPTAHTFSPTMDNSPDGVSPDLLVALSYDDDIAYEEQVPTHLANDPEHASLANRIGSSKVYLLSETSVATGRVGKVRW